MDKMRRYFYTCCESNCGDAQPKQFSAEEQNHDADERANNCDRKVHRRILDNHGVEAFAAANAFVFDFGARHKHRYTARIRNSKIEKSNETISTGSIFLLSAAKYAK